MKPKPNSPRLVAGATADLAPLTSSFKRPSMKSLTPSRTRSPAYVVGVANEAVATSVELFVQVVEHDVGEERRQRRPLGGARLARLLDAFDHDPGVEIRPMSFKTVAFGPSRRALVIPPPLLRPR